MTDTPICKHPGCNAPLISRGPAERTGMTLFSCSAPEHHKNQGVFKNGLWHISVCGPCNKVAKTARLSARGYAEQVDAIFKAGYSAQDIFNEGINSLLQKIKNVV